MKFKLLMSVLISGLLIVSCSQKTDENKDETKTLKSVYAGKFLIGAAINDNHVFGRDTEGVELIKKEFNSLTPENLLKWESVHPEPGKFNFEPADKYVELGTSEKMFVVGHTLIWHQQTPDWVFEDEKGNPASREILIARMKDHILQVAGRYKSKINGWDVVNEALEENGELRKSKWYNIIGEDFIKLAFEYAKEADPDCELYYNDYNIWKPGKARGAIKLIKSLREQGCKVDGIGIQAHWGLNNPSKENIVAALEAYKAAGIKVMITELDVNVLPNPWDYEGADISTKFELLPEVNQYTEELPDSVSVKQAEAYANYFKIFLDYKDIITRVTFWGVDDGHSWKNNWPVKGRTDYPLLFDRKFKPKKAYKAVIDLVN
ncbi:MAG: endo-1,4-beta-xylanase [Melioribacteraceae bacterium]|nr:endo-1,4-beta-xylanase [Melioribacteraceae bacterium]